MDEHNSELRNSNWRMGRRIAASGVKIFQIETTLNTNTFPDQMAFLQKREWEWSLRDRASFLAVSSALERTPSGLSRKIFHSIQAPHDLTSVQAGEVEAVHQSTLANIYRQQLVEVSGQTDVLTMGLPYICPYNVNSTMNPILVACLGLGYFFNLYRNKPLVREGGVLSCPTRRRGSSTPSTTRATSISSSRCSPRRGTCSRSRRSTRSPSPPIPGTCTFTGRLRLPRGPPALHVVLVRPCPPASRPGGRGRRDRAAVRRLGFSPASTLDDALEMAEDVVGRDPTITHLHVPPLLLAEVT